MYLRFTVSFDKLAINILVFVATFVFVFCPVEFSRTILDTLSFTIIPPIPQIDFIGCYPAEASVRDSPIDIPSSLMSGSGNLSRSTSRDKVRCSVSHTLDKDGIWKSIFSPASLPRLMYHGCKNIAPGLSVCVSTGGAFHMFPCEIE